MADSEGARAGDPGGGSVVLDLGFTGLVRLRASTRVRLSLTPVSPALTIAELSGPLPLRGEADNLGSELEAKLVWLVQRPGGGPPEELSHPVSVVVVPSKTTGGLGAVPFEIKELHEQPPAPDGAKPPPEKKALAFDVMKLGLYGAAPIGFRLEPKHPAASVATLAPGSAGVTVAIPVEVELLDRAGSSLSLPAPLHVGSDVTFRVKSGSMFDGYHARLRIWESEGERPSGPIDEVGLDVVFPLGHEAHVETVRLGVGAGALWYTIAAAKEPSLRFRYLLTLLDRERKAIPGARPVRVGLIVDAPPPALAAWTLALIPAAAASSAGPPLFRAHGKITNLATDFAPGLSVTLATLTPRAAAKGQSTAEICTVLRREVKVATAVASADGNGAEGAPEPGSFVADFVLPQETLTRLAADKTTKLFAAVSFPDGKNGTQPFAELVTYAANMKGGDDNTGFAPYVPGALALPQSGTGVCTDLVDIEGQVTELESDAVPTKAPPPWYGDPWGPLSAADAFSDLAPWEGLHGHMYRDNAKEGFITCGIGNKLDGLPNAQALPFWNMPEGRAATPEEIARAWNAIAKLPPAMNALKYVLEPNIALPYDEILKLFERRFAEFHKAAHDRFADFDTYPKSSRRGILDMLYALGGGGFDKFKAFSAAVRERKWKKATGDVLEGGNADRTAWRRALFDYAQTVEDEKAVAAGTDAPPPAAPGKSPT